MPHFSIFDLTDLSQFELISLLWDIYFTLLKTNVKNKDES